MKFRCERDILVESLATASKAVSKSLPSLSGVKARLVGNKLNLTGSDRDLTISVDVEVNGEDNGETVIPARLAGDIVKSVKPGAVTLEVKDESLSISAGKSEFSIRLLKSDDYPDTQKWEGETLSLESEALNEALRQVTLAASSDDSRPILTGVLMAAEKDGLRLVATDSYRLSMRDVSGISVLKEGQQVLIPSKALTELNRVLDQGDKVELQLGESEAAFNVGNVRLITRLIEGEFPDYRGLIPDANPNVLTVNREEFIEALKRVKLLAQESTPVKIEMTKDSTFLVADTQDVGSAREEIDATYDGDDLTVAFNPQYLLEGAEVTPGEEITLSTIDQLKPALVRSPELEGYLYLVMPVRVS